VKKKRYDEEDGKTNVGMRIERTTADFFRDAVKLAFILFIFSLVLALLAAAQYFSCLRVRPDVSFLECVAPRRSR
jgi:hypothetical protein